MSSLPVLNRVVSGGAYTDEVQGVFEVNFATGLTLIEIADGVTVEEVKSKTEAPFKVAENLKPML